MNVKIVGGTCVGSVKAIPSKSYAHRIAICNFLAGKQPSGGCVGFSSKDITATEECLKAVLRGATALDCGESGSTLRFLLPVLAARGGTYTLIGHGKLMERPNDELFRVLSQHGVECAKTDVITLNGKLSGGCFEIRGDVSSQYVTGLLMALPTLDEDSEIKLITPLASAPYVDITLQVLKQYGIEILLTENGFTIKGGQKYACRSILPEGDWSNAAFFLALGALSGDISVSGLNIDSVQGDRAIMQVLKDANANVEISNGDIRVKKSKLKAFVMDAKDCPDLVPICAVIAANAEGKSIINNVERLRIKESDRIASTIEMLSAFGIKAESDGKTLFVFGAEPKSGTANSFNDHRIAMAAAVLAATCKGESLILDAMAVNKSYPVFYEHLQSVGGKVSGL